MVMRAYPNVIAAIGCCLSLVIAACVPSAPTTATKAPASAGTGTAGPAGMISVRLPGDWDQLDPHKMISSVSWPMVSAMYDRLITQTPDGKYHPYLATSWEVLPSGFRFTLRTDAKCADGTPVTSEIVANSFKRFFANSYYSSEFGPGPHTVTADDATHLTIQLAQPNSAVIYNFARPPTSVVCPAGMDPNVDLNTTSHGSGPFTLTQATHGDKAVVKARGGDWTWGPHGWKATDAGFPETIEFRIVNPTTAANLLVTRGIDVSQGYGDGIARLASSDLTHKVARSFLADLVAFGAAPGQVTASEQVRKALATAIDRAAFIQAYAAGYADPADSTLSPEAECFDADTGKLMQRTDLEQARSILRADGCDCRRGWQAGEGRSTARAACHRE